ncbi:molybdopterin-binding protein [Subtercola boreus]|uniref:Molybdopterin-binding protein n=1 Tax=Subtercola boreus TaxID=120213 RepID=A0A3E0VQH0_9MICO|nr:molybdopterin-dependent oxidoreductase [Subtercola boreus]RFA11623.1 molybdopterin-binding protein [Subtercola boreus]
MRRLLLTLQHAVAAPTRNPRLAVVIGRLLGLAFLVCFGTGLYSHFLQEPLPWMHFPTFPGNLYQFTQGIHITAGIACFPLILAKLYTVFPNLFETPPITGIGSLLARASIAVFVGASLVEITIGLLNTYQFYPWPFGFREVHFALSFVIIGSLAIHIGVKLPIIAKYWRKRDGYGPALAFDDEERAEINAPLVDVLPAPLQKVPGARQVSGLTGRLFRWIDAAPAEQPGTATSTSRRGFLVTVGVGVAAVVVLTAGQSFALLRPFNLFAPRVKGIGPQAVPVNRTAVAAQVTETAMAPDWALTLGNGSRTLSFSRAELLAMPQTTVDLPIACVEGWSQMATWTGVRLNELVRRVDAGQGAALRITSLEKEGGYRVTQMGSEYVGDDNTLVALTLNGETLDIDHGYPARMIAPGRPGVLQTKWLSKLEVLS